MKKGLFTRIFISMIVLSIALPITAFAQGAIDVEQDCNFTIITEIEDSQVSGMHYDVYKVADVDQYGSFSITEKFRNYGSFIDFSDMGEERGDEIASALKPYIEKDGIEADYTGDSGESGTAELTVKPGLYLVIGDNAAEGSSAYSVFPFLAVLPERSDSDNSWNYNVKAYPKCEKSDEISDLTVVKVWHENQKKHPDEVTIDLLKDGSVEDTVKLNASNNWKYEWKDLSSENKWSVAESNVPSGYFVGYSYPDKDQEYVITITNTEKNYTPGNNTPNSNGSKGKEKLPQTGLLWWPVFALVSVGLVLIIIGLVRRNSAGEK